MDEFKINNIPKQESDFAKAQNHLQPLDFDLSDLEDHVFNTTNQQELEVLAYYKSRNPYSKEVELLQLDGLITVEPQGQTIVYPESDKQQENSSYTVLKDSPKLKDKQHQNYSFIELAAPDNQYLDF